MDRATRNFVDRLVALSPVCKAAYDEAIAYWSPDQPPVTTLLSDIGTAIVDHVDQMPDQTAREIFATTEVAMTSGDTQLETMVATGLIEGMVGRAARSDDGIAALRGRLGAESRAHADAWSSAA